MKKILPVLLFMLSLFTLSCTDKTIFYTADDARFGYMGRIDFSDKARPKMWASATQVSFAFKGTSCTVVITDEELYGTNHNYINIIVDGNYKRIKLKEKSNNISIAEGLTDEAHQVVICKSTEAGTGYIQFEGIYCRELLRHPEMPERKIESFGDSITCGMDSDISEVGCGMADWYDNTNAYLSYAAITARKLNARYQLTSVSGIGLMHSCCNMPVVMPQVYDKISLMSNTIPWDFSSYQPDVVTICLGQNDGIQDSTEFCNAYVKFINTLRTHYPKTSVLCLSSPMADAALFAVQKTYLAAVKDQLQSTGDKNVYTCFFSKQFSAGCDGHPSLTEHEQIAAELITCIKNIKNW